MNFLALKKINFLILIFLLFANIIYAKPFSLYYETVGSELPVRIYIKISREGKFEKTVFQSMRGMVITTGEFNKKDLNEFIQKVVYDLKFFTLPKTQTSPHLKMDMANSFLTINYDGKSHKIGGYDVMSFENYNKVFSVFYELEKKVKNKKVRDR